MIELHEAFAGQVRPLLTIPALPAAAAVLLQVLANLTALASPKFCSDKLGWAGGEAVGR